jgi:hypothetical protein
MSDNNDGTINIVIDEESIGDESSLTKNVSKKKDIQKLKVKIYDDGIEAFAFGSYIQNSNRILKLLK